MPRQEPTNDHSTWWVDWTQPIEWDDGTPAERHGTGHFGQEYVLLDPENLPTGFNAGGLRRISTHGVGKAPTVICTNVMAAKGSPMHPMDCYIVNTSERLAQTRLEKDPRYGTF